MLVSSANPTVSTPSSCSSLYKRVNIEEELGMVILAASMAPQW